VRLLDVLAANREAANLAAMNRDAKAEKTAAEKEAGIDDVMAYLRKGLEGAVTKVKGMFTPSVEQRAAKVVKDELAKRLQVLQVTSPLNPMATQLKADPHFADWFQAASTQAGKSQLHGEVETLKSIGQGLSDASKKPGTSVKALAIMGLAGAAGASALGRLQEMHRHEANLRLIMDDPSIPTSHKQRAENAFKILANYAPSIANDPIFSKDFVRNLVRFDMIDHKIVSDLIQAEKNYLESKGRKGQFLGSMRDTALGVLLGTGG
jgi:hypothetical protein